MSTENSGTIRVTRRFNFPVERVFDAWLDPDKASKTTGFHRDRCAIEARAPHSRSARATDGRACRCCRTRG